MKSQLVSTVAALLRASQDTAIRKIELQGELLDVPSFTLAPSQALVGAGPERSVLRFLDGADGLCLTANNTVEDLALLASPSKRAIWNDDTQPALGTIVLRNLSAAGQVQLLATNQVRSGHVDVRGLHILAADTTAATQRPHVYGVDVLQGAFTLWNMQSDPSVVLTSTLTGLSAGRVNAPVLGGGILVSRAANNGGRVQVERLETGAVYSNGKIPAGTTGVISGGVFLAYGASADLVRNLGPVTTYGPNDMALDNWGSADRWIAIEKITTLGPSGIGFVNFGQLGLLRMEAPIETFGEGARGFNDSMQKRTGVRHHSSWPVARMATLLTAMLCLLGSLAAASGALAQTSAPVTGPATCLRIGVTLKTELGATPPARCWRSRCVVPPPTSLKCSSGAQSSSRC